MFSILIIYTIILVSDSESARILFVIPTPSLSHQVVFRPLTQELAKHHEVVVLTTDPAYNQNDKPENLTEIDIHDVSYNHFRKHFRTLKIGEKTDSKDVFRRSFQHMIKVIELQLQQSSVKELFTESFDLVLVETWFRPFLMFTAFWQVPVIKISSFNVLFNDYNNIGSFEHPLLYPSPVRQKIFDLTLWDKISQLYNDYNHYRALDIHEQSGIDVIRKYLGSNIQTINKLNENVQMLYVNVFPIWGSNRPLPLSVVYLGGIYKTTRKPLPEDLQSYMDASTIGVIYFSLGTHVVPSTLPANTMQMIISVLSQLPYNVLFKWDLDIMPGKPDNIKIAQWFPQTDILRHPNMKLFITQGGLQSTEDAIRSSVPLLCIPMFFDHWYNAERYIHYGIGAKAELETLTAERLTTKILTILKDEKRYRENLKKFRAIIEDQPLTSLERAVWWTEHVLRHGGARHLRAPAANMGWAEYYELELVMLLVLAMLFASHICYVILKNLMKLICNLTRGAVKHLKLKHSK